MPRLQQFLVALLLTACGEERTPSSDTGTTDVAPTSTGTTGPVDPTTSGDPPLDDEGSCENFLPPIDPAELPPGEVGAPYEASFTMGGEKPAGITWEVDITRLPPGLAFDEDTVILSGTPTLAGEYTVDIEARVDGDGGDCPTKPESRTYPLTIAP